MSMFSYFFGTEASEESSQAANLQQVGQFRPSNSYATMWPNLPNQNQGQIDSSGGQQSKKNSKDPEKYNIDPAYYFKHLDPKQIDTVLANFGTEIKQGQ